MHSLQVPTIAPHRVKFLPSIERPRELGPSPDEGSPRVGNTTLRIPNSLKKRKSKSTHQSVVSYSPPERFPLIDYFHKPPPLRSTRQRARFQGSSQMHLLSYSGLASPKGKQNKKSAVPSPPPP